MTRSVYGTPEVTGMTGVPMVAPATVKNGRTAGSTVTDVQNISGGALSGVVTPDSFGQILFLGPDNFTDTLWLDFGSGPRWAVAPLDISATIAGKYAAIQAAEKLTPSALTPRVGLPYMNNSIGQSQMTKLDQMVTSRVANQAAQNAAFPSPTDGDTAYRLDQHAVQTYNSGAGRWVNNDTLIQEKIVDASNPNSVVFSGFPQTFRHLRIEFECRCGSAGSATAFPALAIQFNLDGGANYKYATVNARRFRNTSAVGFGETDETGGGAGAVNLSTNPGATATVGMMYTGVYTNATSMFIGYVPGTSMHLNARGGGTTYIRNYAAANVYKSVMSDSGWAMPPLSVPADMYGCRIQSGGTWNNTAPITSMTVLLRSSGLLYVGSVISLYGVA